MEYHINSPIEDIDTILDMKIYDTVYIDGLIFTARDEAHRHMLENGPPVVIESMALYHCGPLVRRRDGEWEIVSAGPTSSIRMDGIEGEFIHRFGIRVIIGKGGMGHRTLDALRGHGVYLAFTGGAGALAAASLKVRDVFLLDELGAPEAVWLLEARNFGPLTVTMDSHGNSVYENIREGVRRKLSEMEGRDVPL